MQHARTRLGPRRSGWCARARRDRRQIREAADRDGRASGLGGLKLVQTLVVRDEADIVDSQLAYHLAAGIDFVLATDHDSSDGTTEILERYERERRLRLFRESGPMEESAWRTKMARLAATEHGADWILNTDADEFWMPPRGTLKEALAAVPPGRVASWARWTAARPNAWWTPSRTRGHSPRLVAVSAAALAP